MSLEITAQQELWRPAKHYTHHSTTLNCEMRFAIYLPPQAANGPGAGAVLAVGADLHR